MQITQATCPECGARFIVDQKLWDVGTARLRCVACRHLFLPPGSPRSLTLQQAVNAAVPVRIWEPGEGG